MVSRAIMAVLAFGIACGSAQARFQVLEARLTDGATAVDGGAVRAPKPELIAQGFGNNVPLSLAVRQIVPESIQVAMAPGVNGQQLVSWRGGAAWSEVLSRTLSPLGLGAKTEANSVTVMPAGAAVATGTDPERTWIWTARRGQTLREILDSWAEEAGWHVTWYTGDRRYEAEGEASFVGKFEEVVPKLLKGWQTAKPNPKAKFYPENRHVVVSAKGDDYGQ